MCTKPPRIEVRTEPIGIATRVIGSVNGREVIYISNSAGGQWMVGGSSCLPTDLYEAAASVECMRRAMLRAREHGAPIELGSLQ